MDRDVLELAKDAVRTASAICARVRRAADVGETEKGDRSPVTVADFASQAAVARLLAERSPYVPLVAEEGSDDLRKPGMEPILARVAQAAGMAAPDALQWIDRGRGSPGPRFWTLDPVDGTKGYLRNEQYAIAMALVENGRVTLGVLGCPNLPETGHAPPAGGSGTLFWAARGQGGWCELLPGGSSTRRLRVSGGGSLGGLRVCESVEAGHSRHDIGAELKRGLGIEAEPVRLDSQAKYGLVARGEAEVYWRLPTVAGYQEKIWDHAAGALLVAEAGGRVTDIEGRPLDFSKGRTLSANRGVLCTHGPLHDAVLDAIGRVRDRLPGASGPPGSS